MDSATTYYADPAKRHRCRLGKFQSEERQRCPPAMVVDSTVHNQIKTTVLSVWLFSKETARSPLKKQEKGSYPAGRLPFSLC